MATAAEPAQEWPEAVVDVVASAVGTTAGCLEEHPVQEGREAGLVQVRLVTAVVEGVLEETGVATDWVTAAVVESWEAEAAPEVAHSGLAEEEEAGVVHLVVVATAVGTATVEVAGWPRILQGWTPRLSVHHPEDPRPA